MNRKEILSTSSTILFRKLAGAVAALPMRSEQEQTSDGLTRSKELNGQGYGIVILSNHFSNRDQLEVIKLVFKNHPMSQKPILSAMAFHVYKKWYELPGKALNIKPCPIVTQDTIDQGKNNDYPLGYGKTEFLRKALETLQNGGIVLMAPQTGRRESLGKPERRAVGTFIAQTDRKDFHKYAFLFVGFGIQNAKDYKIENTGGYNPFKKYQLIIGPTFTKEEVMREVNGERGVVDDWAFEQLNMIVPQNYKQRIGEGA